MTEQQQSPPRSPRPRTTPSRERSTSQSGVASPLLAFMAVLAVALVAMIFWNLSLRGDVDSLEQEVANVRGENASLRESANATVYQLLPTEEAPENAHAQAWFSLQGSGVLSVANMPQPEDGMVYQFWYVTDSPNAPIPGGTFTVDSNGQGFMLIPPDVAGVTSIAVSLEPEGGSTSPTGAILLTSDVSNARG